MNKQEFVKLAMDNGYTVKAYWESQWDKYQAGCRNQEMHDFTLANLSRVD